MTGPYVLHVSSPEADFTLRAFDADEARALGARALRDETLSEPLRISVVAQEHFRREPDGGRREALFAIYRR